MKLYEIELGGAVYWAVAPDICAAVITAYACWTDEDCLQEAGDGFSIEPVTDERAAKLKFRPGDEGPDCSMAEEAARQTKPCVIACSEWP